MPKGKHIINNKQKRAAQWVARFLHLWGFLFLMPLLGKRLRDAALYTFVHHYTFAAKSKSLII